MWDDFARMHAIKNSIPLNNYLISHLMKYDEIFLTPWLELFAFKITELNNPTECQRGEVFPYVK